VIVCSPKFLLAPPHILLYSKYTYHMHFGIHILCDERAFGFNGRFKGSTIYNHQLKKFFLRKELVVEKRVATTNY
jgi:hypothetical protein